MVSLNTRDNELQMTLNESERERKLLGNMCVFTVRLIQVYFSLLQQHLCLHFHVYNSELLTD